MNYYPFHLGDYTAHTSHLELLEDLAYRRLLDLYYLKEELIPRDIQETARLIRMKAHTEDVETVLREFFKETESGWRHSRCDEEIAHMQDKQEKAKASAAASVRWPARFIILASSTKTCRGSRFGNTLYPCPRRSR